MAIADTPFNRIQATGFQTSLEDLITYAETQASLYQSLGDQNSWEFWVRAWASLQRAADAIDYPDDQDESQLMWIEYREGFESLKTEQG